MTPTLAPPPVRSSKYHHAISTPETLLTAWVQVRNNAAARGELPKSIETFAKSAFDQIEELSRQLRTGTLELHQLTPVRIKKPHGGVRQLHLPSVRDRVVERAILNEISPVVDMKMSPMSFAYRAGTTTGHAAQTLRELGTEGIEPLFRTDITDCFGSIDMEAAIALLDSWINDAGLASLLRQLAQRSVRGQNGAYPGLPQGAPLSPLLSNVYLTQFDNAVSNRGVAMVRYADDIAALATQDSSLRDAEQIIEEEANRLSLRKTNAFSRSRNRGSNASSHSDHYQ